MSTTGLLTGGLVSSVLGAMAGLTVALWCGGDSLACQAATLVGAVAGSFVGWKLVAPLEPAELSGSTPSDS